LIINHHNLRNIYEKIVQIADELSCKEEKYVEDMITDREPKYIRPIFTKIIGESNQAENHFYYNVRTLNLDNIFPSKDKEIDVAEDYRIHYDKFIEELKVTTNMTQLTSVLERYLWCIPITDSERNYDISLFSI